MNIAMQTRRAMITLALAAAALVCVAAKSAAGARTDTASVPSHAERWSMSVGRAPLSIDVRAQGSRIALTRTARAVRVQFESDARH